jgi:hypothetical protein
LYIYIALYDIYLIVLMFRLIKSVRHFATKSPLGLFRERELLYQNTAQPILDSSTFADDIRQQN